jgi:hypothetical protein
MLNAQHRVSTGQMGQCAPSAAMIAGHGEDVRAANVILPARDRAGKLKIAGAVDAADSERSRY